jgi:aminoglycoside/choline kinase family phosphotransferase
MLDGELAVVLQEDLGDESLQRRLRSSERDEQQQWLSRAIDLLITIQTEGTKAADPESDAYRLAFDEEKLNWELNFFSRYYGAYRQLPLGRECGACRRVRSGGSRARRLSAFPVSP